MVENPKKISKIKETEKLKYFQEEESINSPTNLTQINIIQNEPKNNENTSTNKDKFKNKDHYLNKGNIKMYLFDKNGIPKIVIGPHCKNINILYL
jgi:hypothetical protein